MSMRIGINALQVRAAKSGVGQYIDCLVGGLLQCMAPSDSIVLYVNPSNARLFSHEDPRLERRVFGPRAGRAMRLAHEWLLLPRQLRLDRLDVFHGPSNFLPRALPCPAVVTIHDASRWVDPGRYTRANLTYWHWMTRHTLSLQTPVITVSHAAAADLEQHLGITSSRIHVIHEAAHPRFRPIDVPQPPRPFALHVGTIEPGKNLVRLLEAFARFRQTHPQHELVLAGDRGWKVEEVFQAIERLNLQGIARHAGHVSDQELVTLCNQAQFFVFPSLNEGFGLPPLETMQCGTPVIASNLSSLPEVLGDAPLFVNPLDVESIAQAMCELADSPQLRDELRLKGLRQAAKYDWKETARKTLQVYRTTVTPAGRPA